MRSDHALGLAIAFATAGLLFAHAARQDSLLLERLLDQIVAVSALMTALASCCRALRLRPA